MPFVYYVDCNDSKTYIGITTDPKSRMSNRYSRWKKSKNNPRYSEFEMMTHADTNGRFDAFVIQLNATAGESADDLTNNVLRILEGCLFKHFRLNGEGDYLYNKKIPAETATTTNSITSKTIDDLSDRYFLGYFLRCQLFSKTSDLITTHFGRPFWYSFLCPHTGCDFHAIGIPTLNNHQINNHSSCLEIHPVTCPDCGGKFFTRNHAKRHNCKQC